MEFHPLKPGVRSFGDMARAYARYLPSRDRGPDLAATFGVLTCTATSLVWLPEPCVCPTLLGVGVLKGVIVSTPMFSLEGDLIGVLGASKLPLPGLCTAATAAVAAAVAAAAMSVSTLVPLSMLGDMFRCGDTLLGGGGSMITLLEPRSRSFR